MIAESTVKQRRIHPNSLANLQAGRQSWKPGQSGNPKGPPPSKVQFWRYVQIFTEMSAAKFKAVKVQTLPINQQLAYGFVVAMLDGDWQRIKEALDRDEGPIIKKVEQALTHNGQVSHLHELAPAEAEASAMAMLDQTAAARQMQTGAIKLLPGLPTAAAAPPIDTTATPTGGGAETGSGVEVERCVVG